MTIRISPSLLAADFSCLADEIRRAEDAGADMLHLDIMDGHFVPNLTIGPPVVRSLRKITDLFFDVHLMLDNAQEFLQPFVDAGANAIGVHLEVYPDPRNVLDKIRDAGVKSCLVLNPDTPVDPISQYLDHMDKLLLMSVFPGFGGQAFIENSYSRIRDAREIISNHDIELQVDGGVCLENAAAVKQAGATNLVVGTATFRAPDMKKAITQLRNA